jgi:hypothetical protein
MSKFPLLAIFLVLLTFSVAAQNKKVNRRVSVSPNALRAQVMRDGLREALKGCKGLSAVRIASQNIDLNNDGQPEIVATVSSPCFGAHGSKVWVYRNTGGKLSALLTGIDGVLEMDSGSTGGFRDIMLVSGTSVLVYKDIYKYSGSGYRYAGGRRYLQNENGELVLQEVVNP